MRNPKQTYSAPVMEVQSVELESPICGGSLDITATTPGVSTSEQVVNEDFGKANDFTDIGWDPKTTGE